MADEIRVNRPQQPVMRPDGSQGGMEMSHDYRRRGGSKMPWIILLIVVVVLVVLGVLFRDKLFPSNNSNANNSNSAASLKGSGYSAVFLTNGQVYFGKMADATDQYVDLKDIYYLQVTNPPLQGSQQTNSQQSNAQPQLSLVKLGQELHGPVDEMKINRDQILFYEGMKEDGKVMQAIREYQKNPPANAPAANGNVNTTPAPSTNTNLNAK